MYVTFKGRKVEITMMDWGADPVDAYAHAAQYMDRASELEDYPWLSSQELDELNSQCAAEIQELARLHQAGG